MRRRVVVTGLGCVTPVGNDVNRCGSRCRTAPTASAPSATSMRPISPPSSPPKSRISNLGDHYERPERFDLAGRNVKFAVAAAMQAVKDSGVLDTPLDPTQFGVYLGAGEGQQDFAIFMNMIAQARHNGELDLERFTKSGLERLNPQQELEQEPNMPAGHLASLFNAQGPNLNCLTACAASSQAIGEATEIIRRGDADVMLSGGAHSMIHPFGVTGFNLLTALSTRNRGSDPRLAALRQEPRRVRARRRGRHAGSRRARAGQGPQRADLRRSRGLRLQCRRLPHHRYSSRRTRRDGLHEDGPPRRATQSGRPRLHQRPRHQHDGQRPGGDDGH